MWCLLERFLEYGCSSLEVWTPTGYLPSTLTPPSSAPGVEGFEVKMQKVLPGEGLLWGHRCLNDFLRFLLVSLLLFSFFWGVLLSLAFWKCSA